MGIDSESASESGKMKKGLWLKKSLKNYFGIPVQVSDPLLNVAKWIAYVTEIGATVMVATPLLLYFLVVIIYESARLRIFLTFAMVCLAVGLMAICYLHFMWVKPSRHLLLGLQQRRLRTNLTYSDWILGFVLSTVIITPQVIVLAAQWRVRRFSNERARIRSPSPSREPETIGNPAVSLQPDDDRNIRQQQYVCLPHDREVPEESPYSQIDLDDLPPSYSMAVLQCPPEYSKVQSTLNLNP